MTPNPDLQASYDANGNIILTGESGLFATPKQMEVREAASQIPQVQADDSWAAESWEEVIVSANGDALLQESPLPGREPRVDVAALVTSISAITRDALDEGLRQYSVSASRAIPVLRETGASAGSLVGRLWNTLSQPVWVPTRRRTLKQYSRGTLFAFDIVRFGTTFAGIFAILFLMLNYQSFWQISSAQVTRLLSGASLDGGIPGLSGSQEELVASIAADARREGDLLSYLPTVGPPENRIVIPKLNLNVPLVNPSYDALLRQDWTQVETDIQEALQRGVVHYPGTARPGQAGNFFVTGHSSYYLWAEGGYKTVFARLHELKAGDEYWVYYGGDRHRYIVRSKTEVQPSDVSVLDQPEDARISTLMTCTPVGTTLRRLIVRAEEVDPVSGEPLKVGERADEGLQARPALEALPI